MDPRQDDQAARSLGCLYLLLPSDAHALSASTEYGFTARRNVYGETRPGKSPVTSRYCRRIHVYNVPAAIAVTMITSGLSCEEAVRRCIQACRH
jgi:hypothetical protein